MKFQYCVIIYNPHEAMKSIYYFCAAVAAIGGGWFSIHHSQNAPLFTESEEQKTAPKVAIEPHRNTPVFTSDFTPIPKVKPHSCEGCSQDTPQNAATAILLAEHKRKTWPIAATKYIKDHFKVSQKTVDYVIRAISYTHFEQLPEERLARVVQYAASVQGLPSSELLHLCWSPDTPAVFQQAMDSVRALALVEAAENEPLPVFQGTDRWRRTATDGFNIPIGRPVTITWGFIPDGTAIGAAAGFPAGTSNLVATLNTTYGAPPANDLQQAPWFELFETAFNYWAEVTGNIYIYEANDDGLILNGITRTFDPPFDSRGFVGIRPDVRIGGMPLTLPDGETSSTLAFNYFPDAGDMVINTSNAFNFTDNNITRVRFRNVIAHEHGHGLGFGHVCPQNQTKLMEPSATTQFIGVQFDDMITAQGIYGDPRERNGDNTNNNITATASNLSTISDSFESEPLSISRTGDVDIFRFSVSAASQLTVRVIPTTEPAYPEASQNSNGTCSAGTPFDPNNRQNLSISVLDTDGTTVLATANSQGIGLEETISNLNLPQSNQDYFIQVSGGGENDGGNISGANNAQIYSLVIDIESAPFNFAAWQQTFFGNNTTNIAEAEDFDFDGIRNLVEYALGLDPTSANPQQPIAELESSSNTLTLTFVEDTTLTDIEYIVEVSPTLGQNPDPWTSDGVTLNQGDIVDGKRTVTASTPANITRQFIRLRIDRN